MSMGLLEKAGLAKPPRYGSNPTLAAGVENGDFDDDLPQEASAPEQPAEDQPAAEQAPPPEPPQAQA
jgi:hypothetical protein